MRVGLVTRNARLYSSRRFIEAIRGLGHEPIIVDPFRCVLSVNPVGIRHKNRPLKHIDVAIPRVGAMGTSVVLAVLRQLQLQGTTLLNSADAIGTARDKLATLQRLQAAGIPVPPTVYSVDSDQLTRAIRPLGTPTVFKVLDGLQGAGVVLAESERGASSVIDWFQASRTDFVAQAFIHEAENADIRCLVLDGKVIAAMRRQAQNGDFRSNLHRGGTAELVVPTDQEVSVSIAAAAALGLRLAGVDLLRTRGQSVVIEVNASPGIEGIEGVALQDLARLIVTAAIL
ncbi:RimK family alpha-L-glutamate ligase [bacterium]|nr:RimK family alpha-L-glutamate ligase [bacterium]